MKPITLKDVEDELNRLADDAGWGGVSEERVRALARRIGTQLALEQIEQREVA